VRGSRGIRRLQTARRREPLPFAVRRDWVNLGGVKDLEADLPRVFLNRAQWVRLVVVGALVVFALGRVVPDFVRVIYPLSVFDYVTDGDGIVISARATAARPEAARTARPKTTGKKKTPAPPGRVTEGDRVRIDRIKPYDRKPGLAGVGFTYDNPDRMLPVERAGHLLVLHLAARSESAPSRFFAVLRILIFIASVGLGAILFLIKPSIATAAFFVFCLGAEAPTTYLDLLIPNPWRQVPQWIGDTLRGGSRPALVLFALCLIDGDTDAPRERVFAYLCAAIALVLGTVDAYGSWLLTYAGRPAGRIDRFSTAASDALTAITALTFVVALARARGLERQRIVWIVATFVFAAAARLASDELFPRYIPPWLNGVLVSATIVPIVGVWIAVVRQHFFNVDFVVSRAIVYVALTAAAFGTVTAIEELGTYVFYNNTDVAYGFIILLSIGIGAATGKINPFLHHIVDHFIFRNRRDQRRALELIEGYILDAETPEDVYRALLADAAHALQLSFGGFFARLPSGDYALSYEHDWPADCITRLAAGDELTHKLTRTRGALTFRGKDTAIVARTFPGEGLTFAAPIFFDRSVLGIVMYGRNVSGLDLDPEEREHLTRVVAHASIALSAIELARYRKGVPFCSPIAVEVRAI
jgi:hypothetical protein